MQAAQNRRPARAVALPDELHPEVAEALVARGVERLWSHQAEALHAAWAGPTIVTTGTASGKSLCFQLPTLDTLCRDARARALYLYPTKALAQDQARSLAALGVKRARPAIYDGDTPREQRAQIRRRANVILTNPDMLHLGILPNHRAWADVFANLAVVVVDEAHVYRGVFGSHVANVLRRLRRIAAAYGTEPRFLLASATIANPGELAERLTGLPEVTVVERDGSPGGHRTIAMWNPPITDEQLATRRSPLAEAADMLAELVTQGARTIVFMKSRKAVELISRFAQLALEDAGRGDLAERIAPYRAGYTPQQRRELERRLVEGELLGRRLDRRARARDRHRLARRRDLRDVPRHRRVAAPDVGSRRPARARAGALRRRRGRARPVLLPPSGRVPRPPCGGGDPRSVQRADPRRARALRGPRGTDRAFRRRVVRAGAGADRGAARGVRRPAPAAGRHARPAPRGRVPGERGLAAVGRARRVRDRGGLLRRAARHGRREPRVRHDARRRRLPARRPRVRGHRARPRLAARAGEAVRGRLVHAVQARDRPLHRAPRRTGATGSASGSRSGTSS